MNVKKNFVDGKSFTTGSLRIKFCKWSGYLKCELSESERTRVQLDEICEKSGDLVALPRWGIQRLSKHTMEMLL